MITNMVEYHIIYIGYLGFFFHKLSHILCHVFSFS